MCEKISIIIASITDDYDSLWKVIESIHRPNCPYDCELIVVSPHDLNFRCKSLNGKDIIHVKERKSTGSCHAFNTGLKFTTGDYIAINTDDIIFKNRWWNFVEYMDKMNQGIVSLKTGHMDIVRGNTYEEITIPHIFAVKRAFLEGEIMKGYIFNPALTHMYLDIDLGLRLVKNKIALHNFEIYDKNFEDEKVVPKLESKKKSYKLDGMIINTIWQKAYPCLANVLTLYPDSIYSKEELCEMVYRQLQKDISGEPNIVLL